MTTFEDNYDSDHYWFPVEAVQRMVKVRLRLLYKSTMGQVTERDYDVEGFQRGTGAYLMHGYCRLRRARRSLSTSAAYQVLDRETQKTIVNLPGYLEEKYRLTSEYKYDLLLDTHGWVIELLLYFAAADGAVREAERNIIVNLVLQVDGFCELSAQKIDGIVRDMCRPSKSDFHRIVRQHVGTDPKFLSLLIGDAAKIVATNRTMHSEQMRATEYLKRKWKHAIAT